MRERLAASDDEHRALRASALFEALLEGSWSAEIEAESLALIDKLGASNDPAGKLHDQVAALYRGRLTALRPTKTITIRELGLAMAGERSTPQETKA